MAYNISEKLQDNIRAIRIALNHQNGKELGPDEVSNLKKFSGFGGIKAILYPYGTQEEWSANGATKEDLKHHADIMELHDLLKENYTETQYREIISSLRNSVLTAFYTPQVVPETLYTVMAAQNLQPKRLYEPSAGSGIFISEAVKAFPELEQITAVEKDTLSGLVLSAIGGTLPVPAETHITGFEETPVTENSSYDLIVSNIPFGNFSVYDEAYPDKALSGKIHNYFFAKGLDKLADGGLMAYITTDAFLNSPSNQKAREYLFGKSDFISLSVMPDNLMKDTGNTEAPNHLLIVQKNGTKETLSEEETLLVTTVSLENEYGTYPSNSYIQQHRDIITGNTLQPGKNQYGQAHETVWQQGDLNDIREKLGQTITEGFNTRLNRERYFQSQSLPKEKQEVDGRKLTYLPMPENKAETVSVQLGLFDTAPAEQINRAIAYINPLDATVVRKESARLISTIRTTDNPIHESIVLLAAKQQKSNRYLYKLYSNVKEIDHFSANWMDARLLRHELQNLSGELQGFAHAFTYEGDQTLEG
ncbi:Eco57I restriction-modification methylase domain-containing protein, partial [Zunongwangia pacifica]